MSLKDIINKILGKETHKLEAYDPNVAVEVTDLVMEFKVTKDKIDTLKIGHSLYNLPQHDSKIF